MIGETIREFEVQSELGAGGYGAVYRALDTSVNRDVAIKVILPQYADNPDFKQRFEAEAQTVAQLECRQIVPLYSYWQDERGAFLVMRLIRGGSLRRIMSKQGALSLNQVLRIAGDIAEALTVAHEQDVVHRDLKPENILIDERGNAYLTDFGIAKRTTEVDNITEADALMGTWAYLSPEQIQSHDVSPQTDIYAFGIMLYEMLAGKHPYHGTPAPMMIMKHLNELLPDIYDERSDLPSELDDVIQRATAKDPDVRYTQALDLIDHLKTIINDSNQRSAPVATTPKRKKPSSQQERYRQAMLQNLHKFWIEGVLENSAQNSMLLNLGKQDAPDKINNPWDTVVRASNEVDNVISSDATILDIFEQMNGKLLILGEPGGGKTTMLLELARDLLNQASYDEAHPIPVVFNLSSWAEKQEPLKDWLISELSIRYQVPKKVGTTWIENEEILLLLDGLDEVQADVRDACVEAINTYRTEHGFVDMVVCSRIHDYEDLADKLLLNGAIVIQPLTDEQIQQYLQQFGPASELARQLIASDSEMAQLAHSPLMLNIIVQAYKNASTETLPEADTIEDRRQQLFELYVDNALKLRHSDDYTSDESRHFLSLIAQTMQRKGMTLFQLENIEQDWFLSQEEAQRGNIYVPGFILSVIFVVELIATISISSIVGIFWGWLFLVFVLNWVIAMIALVIDQYRKINHVFVGLGAGLVLTILLFLPLYTSITSLQLGVLIIGGMLYGVSSQMLFEKYTTVFIPFEYRPTKYHISPKDMNWSTGLLGGLQAIWVGALLMVVISTLNLVPIISVLSGFILFSIFHTILSGARPKQDDTFYTARELTQIFTLNALKYGLSGMVATMLIVFSMSLILGIPALSGLALAFGFGLHVGLEFFIWAGGTNLAIFLVAIPFIVRLGYLPSDPYAFLNYARQSVLMRQVGKGYIFIHRYLLEYFADLNDDDKEIVQLRRVKDKLVQ